MKAIAKWAVWIPLFIIPFLPLYVAAGNFSILGNLFFPFISGKGFLFRILVEVATGGYLLLALADKRYRPRFSWPMAIYGAFILWMLLADVFGVNPHKAFWSNYERMDGWITMIHVFIFFIVSSSVLSVDKLWKRWWMTVVGASVLVALHGTCQLMIGPPMCDIHQGGTRVDANIGNAAYLAAYLLFTIAASLWLSIQNKGWKRYALLVIALWEGIILYHTATRGALLGFIGAAVVAALVWTFTGGKKGKQVGVGILAGIVLLVGGFFALKDTPFVKNDGTLSRIASISKEDGSTRFTLWHMAYQGVMERPVFGWGQEGFNFIFNKYYEPSLYAQEAWFDRAHNVYIDWLVAGGFPALILFLLLLGSTLFALMKGDQSRAERVLLASALLAYAFQALFVFDNLFTYMLLAAVVAVAHGGISRPIKRFESLPEMSASSVMQVGLPVVGIVTLAALWFVNVPSIYGSQELIYGLSVNGAAGLDKNIQHFKNALGSGTFGIQEVREQLINFGSQVVTVQSIPAQTRSDLLTLAITEMQKEDAATKIGDSRLELMLAQAFEAGGDFKDAVLWINNALTHSPKKQGILVQKGVELWKSGDLKGAKEAFDTAYALDTSFAELAVYVAAGDILNGDTASAQKLLTEKFGSANVNRDVLRFAYYQAKDYTNMIAIEKQKVLETGGAANARLELAQVYALAGRIAEAKAEVQATIAAHPDAAAAAAQVLAQINGK